MNMQPTWRRMEPHAGTVDPLYSGADPCCSSSGPNNYICTRSRGHNGPHRAHYSGGLVCNIDDWPNELAGLEVAEGL